MSAVIYWVLKNPQAIQLIPFESLAQLMILIVKQNMAHSNIQNSANFSSEIENLVNFYILLNFFKFLFQVLLRLKNIFQSSNDLNSLKIIINFLLANLSFPNLLDRDATRKAIQQLFRVFFIIFENLCFFQKDEKESAIKLLSKIPCFEQLKDQICKNLCSACLIENKVEILIEYIEFISEHGENVILNKVCLSIF